MRWLHPRASTSTFAAVQLKLPLWATMLATFLAWNHRSPSDQRPGTTSTGVTHPSSDVTCLSIRGSPLALRRSCSSVVSPQTMASCVRSEPVRWMLSMSGCEQRYCPTSTPPRTMARTLRAIRPAKARSNSGAR